MKVRFLVLFLAIFLATAKQALAAESFVTIVHPIRNRKLWQDKSVKLLEDQIRLSTEHNLATTWLVQYDALVDEEIVSVLKELPLNHEIGLFLEVSEHLATDAFVPYTIGSGNWARPDKVFFSGYTIDERRRLADRLVRTFEATFGYRPKSVGAWYTDAPTLSYLHEKYGIIAALTCVDQYSTDRYQKWGKYFGVPYYPSKKNTLMPGQTEENTLKVVTIQWALRDPVRSYGEGVKDSTYSLQANDYVGHHNLSNSYFRKLFNVYANRQNPVSQVTVGLEVGMESQFLAELDRQINYVAEKRDDRTIKAVTMADFASWFKTHIKANKNFAIDSDDLLGENSWALWWMTPSYRAGLLLSNGQFILRDLKLYDEELSAIDEIFPDRRSVLYRSVPSLIDSLVLQNSTILAKEVTLVKNKLEDNQMVVEVETSSRAQTFALTVDTIIKDSLTIFDAREHQLMPKSKRRFLINLLKPLFRFTSSAAFPPAFFRYSTINGSFYLGIPIEKEALVGLQLKPFNVGRFHFPFQVLSRFKSLPPPIRLQKFYISDAQFEAEKFLGDVSEETISVFPRDFLSLEEILSRQRSGRVRIFENDAVQVWKKE